MKRTFKRSLKRNLAFVCALTILASGFAGTVFSGRLRPVKAADSAARYADDYTALFPGLKDTKLKLRDPKFSSKDWYEYIEYELYTEVQDGDITYRINKPVDFGQASIMAIGDYSMEEAPSGVNLTMDLGELQGILDMAAQGSNISKDFAGLNLASGIAGSMSNIGKVMDNSKYYSQSSFLGIPGDQKYTGVSNDGFYNADSLEVSISQTQTVSACKTVALSSEYSVTETDATSKGFNSYQEASEAKSNTREESLSSERSHSAGKELSDSLEITDETHSSISSSLTEEVTNSVVDSISATIGSETGVEGGVSGVVAKVNASATVGVEIGYTVGLSSSQTGETGQSHSSSLGHTDTFSEEDTETYGMATANSETVENALTNGSGSSSSRDHAKEMAVGIGYGVDYQYGNETSTTKTVTRTFNAREDDEVKNVGWKLCEYVVKIPYYIEAVKVAENGEETVLYGQYVNYNLLNGICRVFANGYIEHWYNGKLVTYADFFDGFVTATELVDKAKAQQSEKAAKEG